ncbi:MAG: hypothetical protein V3V47_00415 [Desulfobacteria bacterium]
MKYKFIWFKERDERDVRGRPSYDIYDSQSYIIGSIVWSIGYLEWVLEPKSDSYSPPYYPMFILADIQHFLKALTKKGMGQLKRE